MFNNKTLTETDIQLLKKIYPNNYQEQIEKVKNGYPVQYLIGNIEFLNTTIKVNEHTLIPRFETEYLTELILKRLDHNKSLKVLDIGTGSGCISIALSKNTNWNITGIDISNKALEIAKENNILNNTNVTFIKKDILKEDIINTYDLIVSNPPYIKKNEIVDPSTKYEPSLALYADNNGLIFYQTIINKINTLPTLLAFEIGETQANEIKNIILSKFSRANIEIIKDLCGKDRYIFIS